MVSFRPSAIAKKRNALFLAENSLFAGKSLSVFDIPKIHGEPSDESYKMADIHLNTDAISAIYRYRLLPHFLIPYAQFPAA